MTLCEPQAGLARFVIVLAAVSAAAPGCCLSRWSRRGDPLTFSQKMPCRLPPNATAEDVVLAVNENVDRLEGWRAGKVKIRANHMPLSLEADLAVEKGRHLRLVVRHPLGGGDELDLGCNDEIFWLWQRRQKPQAVMYASHDQLELVRENLQIPFEPDWLMEALGVAPISAEGLAPEPIPERRNPAGIESFGSERAQHPQVDHRRYLPRPRAGAFRLGFGDRCAAGACQILAA